MNALPERSKASDLVFFACSQRLRSGDFIFLEILSGILLEACDILTGNKGAGFGNPSSSSGSYGMSTPPIR